MNYKNRVGYLVLLVLALVFGLSLLVAFPLPLPVIGLWLIVGALNSARGYFRSIHYSTLQPNLG